MQQRRLAPTSVFGPLAALSAALVATPAAGQATFQRIGELPAAADPYSAAHAISADGTVVVGRSNPPGGSCCAGFRWSSATGIRPLPDLAGGPIEARANAVSGDGRIVVGDGHSGLSRAIIWTAAGVTVQLPELPGGGDGGASANGVSEDGVIIVGSDSGANGIEGYIYNRDTRVIAGIGDLPGGDFLSRALGISNDGLVVVGHGASAQGQEAALWTAATGIEGLGDLPGGDYRSVAWATTATGAAVVGYGTTPEGRWAFRWTRAEGMQPLSPMPGATISEAFATSADGRS